jgi:hypothetical protein
MLRVNLVTSVVGFVMMELQIGGEAVEQYALGRSDQLKGNCASLLRNQSMRSFRSLSLLFLMVWLCVRPDIDKMVSWATDCVHPGGERSKAMCASHSNSLSSLAGKEVAVKVAMADAELYSLSLGCA